MDCTLPRLRYVIIERAEGPSGLCRKPEVHKSLEQASAALMGWSSTAPEPGQGYDKCDFTVVWKDGQTYLGRWDLQRGVTVDLKAQMMAFLLPDEDSAIRRLSTPEELAARAAFVAERNW